MTTAAQPARTRCPECRQPVQGAETECPRCGIIFERWRPPAARTALRAERTPALDTGRSHGARLSRLSRLLLPPPTEHDPVTFAGRAALLVALLAWTPAFVFTDLRHAYVMDAWIHRVHLVFHEAGHVLFSPFGDFMMVLGGTLGQLLMPLIVLGAFLRSRHPVGAAVALWWIGNSLIDCAPYIYDARYGELPLLGGVTGSEAGGVHDWENLLSWTGLLRQDHAIGRATHGVGAAISALALLWGGAALWMEWRARGTVPLARGDAD